MSEIKWIKINTGIFDNDKIKIIEDLPEGDTILVIWLKLLVLAGKKNDDGLVYVTRDLPYNPKTLSKVMGRREEIISLALNTFKSFGMIDIFDNLISIINWGKYQNAEGMDRIRQLNNERQKKYRDKQKQIESNVTSRYSNALDKIRLDKDKNKKESKSSRFAPPSLSDLKEYSEAINYRLDCQQFIDFYSSKGWMIGKNKMKDWKAAVRTWKKREKDSGKVTEIKRELSPEAKKEVMYEKIMVDQGIDHAAAIKYYKEHYEKR